LEAEGVITGYTALVNPAALGRDFEVIIYADLVAKDLATVASFEERLVAMDEVAELRRMFGIPDYFIRVQTADLAAYEQWLSIKLMGDPAIARVDSRLTMKLLKSRR
jgi:DNA-binding Lrp family transcriptional regulator